jgi:predicted NUDIX family NTP pyrophosphohydrolase
LEEAAFSGRVPHKVSAGLLMYRIREGSLEVFLAHPGGPFFRSRDEGSWTIPKGEPSGDEDLLDTAVREFEEEVGLKPEGPFLPLGSIRQKGGKHVHAWAFLGDWEDSAAPACNDFELEWPPGSGILQAFAEIDRVQFFSLDEARRKLKEAQWPLVERLAAWVKD